MTASQKAQSMLLTRKPEVVGINSTPPSISHWRRLQWPVDNMRKWVKRRGVAPSMMVGLEERLAYMYAHA